MARASKQWVALGKKVSSTRYLALLMLLLAVVAPLVFATTTQAAGANLTVTDGNPQFSADEINPGQYTTAHFEVIPFAGTADPEGNSPTITGESFEVAVDNQTTITGVSVAWKGAIVNVTDSTATTEDFNITGSIPNSTFEVDVTVQASQNASTGEHPVTLTGISIQTSKGDGYGNSDTEDFEVEKLAVDILGPPYVIIDNGPGTLVGYPPIYVPPPNVDSAYTAYATGGSGNYTWNWSLSDNIQFDGSYSTDNPVDVYGVDPAGPGDISCEATDTTTGSAQYGNRHPFVHDEYDTVWDSETDGPSGGAPALVGPQVQALAGQGASVTVMAGSSVAVEIGGSISGSIPESDFGLDLSVTQTTETNTGASTEINCPANPQLTLWNGALVPMVLTLYGTGEQWGPNGVVNTDKITKWKVAPPFADAWDWNGGMLLSPAPTVDINPVQPW